MTKLAPRHVLPRCRIADRDSFVVDSCRGKRVLHLGCADWPYTQDRLDTASFLHHNVWEVCEELAGVDISEEGIALLQRRGVTDAFRADTCDYSQLARVCDQLEWSPEIILIGELLEHVDVPGQLLRNCARRMARDTMHLITVPNVFAIKGFLHVFLGREKVHPDHVAYYSYMNVMQLLSRCDLTIVDTLCYRTRSKNRFESLFDVLLLPLLQLRPFLCDGLIFCCRRLSTTAGDGKLADTSGR